MPSVVILHAAEDALPARALAEKLRQAKLTPVIETGSGDAAREAVKSAVVTIALWSPRSVTQQALAEDAAFARGKSKLLHATMQSAQPPEQFRNDKPIDLTGWRGEDDFAPWRALADQVTSKAGVAPLPPPAPRPPSGFFQPGRVDPTAEAAVQANAPKNGPRLERPGHMPPPNLPPVKHQQERGAQPQT
ncbi:MAG: toll/interleukin-1 receptor domain-containing protein, partial [Hyphomonadaceae bacterium]|nr:toll/interleukin-1 receptor domain-containing protein [Hyphomonadaceae bacterium]